MKMLVFLILVTLAAPALAGSPHGMHRHLCSSMEVETARILTAYPDAIRHAMSAEQMAAFRVGVEMPEIDAVIWFTRDAFTRVFVVAFQHGCAIQRGGFDADQLRELMGET